MKYATGIAALLLAMTANAQAGDCSAQVSLDGAYGALAEQSSFGEVAEEAFWPGVRVAMAQPLADADLCGGLDVWARGGVQGIYNGFTQVGARLETDVTHVDFGAQFSLRRPLDDGVTARAFTAIERFDRAIEPKGFTSGITEQYTWYWLGVGGEWQVCSSCRFPVTVSESFATLLDGKSAVNLFQFGNAVIDFDHGSKLAVDVSVGPPAGHPGFPVVTLFWERREFDGTGYFLVPGASYQVRQPAFDVQDTGIRLSFPLR